MNEFGLAEKRGFWKFLGLVFITVLADYATMQADAIIGGKFFGPDAISSVDLLIPVNELFYALALMFGNGANTIASIDMGKGDFHSVRRYFTAGLLLIAFTLGICLVLAFTFRESIAMSLAGDGALYEYTCSYMSAMVFFSAINGLCLIFKLFTAMTGHVMLVMQSSLVQVASNILLDIILVKVCGMGIVGLAIASVISVTICLLVLLPCCLKKDSPFKPVRMIAGELSATVRTILSFGIGYLSVEAAYIVCLFTMNHMALIYLGNEGLYCWSVVIILFSFGYYSTAAGQETCISLGGRYLGASNITATRRIYRLSLLFVTIWILLTVVPVLVSPDTVLPLLGADTGETSARLKPVIYCAIPLVFGSNLLTLSFVRLIQTGKLVKYVLLTTAVYLVIPFLFFVAHWLFPSNEWYGIALLAVIYPLLAWAGSR